MAIANPQGPLFCQGVPRRPVCPPPPPETEHWIGIVPRGGPVACGHAYIDGALRGVYSRAKRAGWAFVVADGTPPLWGKYGGSSEAYLFALRAELRALLSILRHFVGDLMVHATTSKSLIALRGGKVGAPRQPEMAQTYGGKFGGLSATWAESRS